MILIALAIYALGMSALCGRTIYVLAKAKSQNAKLRLDLYEAYDGTVTESGLRELIKSKLEEHNWQETSRQMYTWTTSRAKTGDTLVTERCKKCSLMRRYWSDGVGVQDMAHYAGYFLLDRKLESPDEPFCRIQFPKNLPTNRLLKD